MTKKNWKPSMAVVLTPQRKKTKLKRYLWIKRDGVWHRMTSADFEWLHEQYLARVKGERYVR